MITVYSFCYTLNYRIGYFPEAGYTAESQHWELSATCLMKGELFLEMYLSTCLSSAVALNTTPAKLKTLGPAAPRTCPHH